MSMLDYPVLRHNAKLVDKMFTCLTHASAVIPALADTTAASMATQQHQQVDQPGASQLGGSFGRFRDLATPRLLSDDISDVVTPKPSGAETPASALVAAPEDEQA